MRIFTNIAIAAACTFALPALAEETQPTWVEVNLETPGSLGVEILYQVDVLSDVTHLRVSGAMNSNDWETLQNIPGLQQLDLSKSSADEIPEGQFNGKGTLNAITLPPNLKTIGNNAFKASGLTGIVIPASVETIGGQAFQSNGSLASVEFEEGSNLSKLGENIFYECRALTSIAIPDGVATIPSYAFYQCTNLGSVKLPSSLKGIGSYSFYYTTALSLIDLPESLGYISGCAFLGSGLQSIVIPNGVYQIGDWAFESCSSMTEVVLPGSMSKYDGSQFKYCTAITKVTCRAATPPDIETSTFYGLDRSGVTLCVPDFAVVNYKLHSYWMQFGTIEGGVNCDSYDLAGELTLSNNRRIEGKPAINMRAGSTLSVGGAAPLSIDGLTMNSDFRNSNDFSYPQIINGSAAMTATSVKTVVSLYDDRWYFLTIPYDVKLSEITHSDPSASFVIRYYDGAARAANGSGGWTNVASDATLKAAQGYILQTNKDGTITFPASGDLASTLFTPNAITTKLDLNEAENAAHAGWNLVGNPWQSHYDMYYSMLTSPITVWNHYYSRYDAYSLIDDDVVLAPNQVFFIQATQDVQEIEFGTLGRQFTTEIARAETRSVSGGRTLCNLELGMDGMTDHTRVVINEDASEGYEPERDASKFFSDNGDVPQLFTISRTGDRLAINERPQTDGIVKIGFYAPRAGEMRLSFTEIPGKATLTDNATGEAVNVMSGDTYKFTADKEGFDEGRFVIALNVASSAVDALGYDGSVDIAYEGNKVRISGPAGTVVSIVSIDGAVEASDTIDGTAEYILPAGLHIVKAGSKTVKCIIK